MGFTPLRFNSLCMTYMMLDNEERELFLDMLKRFTFLPLSQYPKELSIAVNQLITSVKTKKIVVYNGMSNREWGYVKSNYLISYQFKGSNLRYNLDPSDKYFIVKDRLKDLLQIKSYDDTTLVLVDDFIGTGDTIENAFSHIMNRLKAHNIIIRNYAVVCIAAMNEAIKRLSNSGIMVFCTHKLGKGISDYYTGEDLARAKRIMTQIEDKIKVNPSYRFGYGQSEALVCMERCPNNTFALFRIGKNAIFKR